MSKGIIERMQAEIDTLKERVSKLEINGIVAKIQKGEEVIPKLKTQQQIRDEIVERAKKDVEKLLNDGFYVITRETGGNFTYKNNVYNVEFIVNKEKRTVVALVKGGRTATLLEKGIAKCAPTDCFNVHIGKAIALRRALGLKVPYVYLNTPQPTDVRVGDIVEVDWRTEIRNEKKRLKVVLDEEYIKLGETCNVGSVFANESVIVDDSRDE